jgi:hypothetical protein
MNVYLIVPELLPDPERVSTAPSGMRVDALELLLARGRRRSGPGTGLEAWLLDAFSVARGADLPAAPYCLVGDGGEPEGVWWMCADPVNLQATRDSVVISDAAGLDISHAETESLVAHLNMHFAVSGVSFHPLRPDRWYARVEHQAAMQAVPTADARGRPLTDLLPQGTDSQRWRALLNEIQMLLHDHPVNLDREAHGAPAVNGVWLWGGGRVVDTPRSRFGCVTSDNPLAKGLAITAGNRHSPLPASARQWLARADGSGVEAIVLEALRAPAAYGDMAAWQAALEALESDWFAPLLGALRTSRIGMITLCSPAAAQTHETETTRQDLRYFWRRRRPLSAYAA